MHEQAAVTSTSSACTTAALHLWWPPLYVMASISTGCALASAILRAAWMRVRARERERKDEEEEEEVVVVVLVEEEEEVVLVLVVVVVVLVVVVEEKEEEEEERVKAGMRHLGGIVHGE
jgi:hypothetical protein